MLFATGMLLRRYWQYLALVGLVFLSLSLARKNGALNAEIDRTVARIDALKQREVIRRESRAQSDDDLAAGLMRRTDR